MSRFSGKAGEEYELFKLACIHYDKMQKSLNDFITKNAKSGSVFLELGPGPGYTTVQILEACMSCKVVAVDNEEVMISQAKEQLNKYSDRVELVLADALEYLKEVDTDYFDGFASGFTLHNFDDNYRHEILNEIARVLKPGAFFINADKYAVDDEKLHRENLNWQLNQFKEKYSAINRPDLIDEWTKHYLEDEDPNAIMKEKESIKYLQSIGFRDVKVIFRERMEAVITAHNS